MMLLKAPKCSCTLPRQRGRVSRDGKRRRRGLGVTLRHDVGIVRWFSAACADPAEPASGSYGGANSSAATGYESACVGSGADSTGCSGGTQCAADERTDATSADLTAVAARRYTRSTGTADYGGGEQRRPTRTG